MLSSSHSDIALAVNLRYTPVPVEPETASTELLLHSWWHRMEPGWKQALLRAVGRIDYQVQELAAPYLADHADFVWDTTAAQIVYYNPRPIRTVEVPLHVFRHLAVADLRRLQRVRQLWLWGCSSLGPASMLTHLVDLDCSHSRIEDLRPLAHLTSLERLNCENSLIRSLLPVSRLPRLSWINIRGTHRLPAQDILEFASRQDCQIIADFSMEPVDEPVQDPFWKDQENYPFIVMGVALLLGVIIAQLVLA